MTGNPEWEEIKRSKLLNSEWQSNPFTVNDIFHVKMQVCFIIYITTFNTLNNYFRNCFSISLKMKHSDR